MDNFIGEKFLDKLYSNLYMSDVVQHTKENKDKRYEAIRKYLDRLEKIHKEANTETKMKLLKSLYYDKYVISKDVLWEKYKAKATNRTDKERLKTAINNIILNQKESLDK